MPNDPKKREGLIAAKFEIEAVLARHGLVGHFCIADGGQSEASLFLSAPWCVAHLEEHDENRAAIRVRALKADFGGDGDKRNHALEETLSALHVIGVVLANQAMTLLNVTETLGEQIGADFGPLEMVKRQ